MSVFTYAQLVDALPNVANAADRTARFPDPAKYQKIFRLDTGDVELWDGQTWIVVINSQVGFFNVEDYGAVGDGVTDDTPAFVLALAAASAVAGTVVLWPGKSYLLGTTLTTTDLHVRILGNGATILRATALGQAEAMVFNASFGAIINVLSLTTTTTTIDAGATPTTVCRIEVADVTPWAVGDTLKVFSADRIPYGSRTEISFTGSIAATTLTVTAISGTPLLVGTGVRGVGVTPGTYITGFGSGTGGTGTYTVNNAQTVGSATLEGGIPRNELYGEIVQVAKIAAPYLYTAKPLRIAPVTSIRIAKLTPVVCQLDDIAFRDPADAPLRHNHPFVQVVGMVAPVFRDLHFLKVMGTALQLDSCFQPRSDRCRFDYCYADLAQFTYGYGIHEFACTDGRHYAIDAGNVRHAYTTGAHETANPTTDPDVTRYGGVVGTVLYNGAVLASGNSGFDTHEDATDVWFIGCTVTQEYQGNAAAGFCFKLRGKDCGMSGCKSTGAGALDLNAVGEGGGFYTVKDHAHVRDVRYTNTTAIARLRSEWAITPARMSVELDCVVDSHPSNLVSVDYTEVALALTGDVAFNTFTAANPGGQFSRCGWISLTNNAVVTAVGSPFWRMDRSSQAIVSGPTQQTPYLVQLVDATACVFRSDRLRVQAGAATQYHLAQGGDIAPLAVGVVLFNDLKVDTTPGAAATYGFYNFAGGTLRARTFIADALIAWQSTVTINSDQTALDVANLTSVIVNTSGGDVNLYGFANGVAGQTLDILKTSSANRLILQHNDATGTQKIFCPLVADVTLTGYAGIRLEFNGTNWYAANGRLETPWGSKSGDYTLLNSDDGLFLTGGTNRTLTLQSAAGRTRPVTFRVTGAGTWAITRAGADTVEGGTSVNLITGESGTFMPSGTNWLLVG